MLSPRTRAGLVVAASAVALALGIVLVYAQATKTAATRSTPPTVGEEVARVGDQIITLADVDAAWQKRDPASRNQVVQQLYEGRRAMLDQLVADAVIAQAAKGKSIAPDVFLKDEIARRRKAPTDADIEAFYAQNRERMQGQPIDVMRGPIRAFLEEQATTGARAALVKDLEAARPGAVSVRLEPPRVTVPVGPTDPIRGPKTSPVEIVEFSDFQCPFCGRVTPVLKQVMDTYGDRVHLVFKDFPLPNHADAPKAAEAARCAGEQQKYWEMHDQLFANQQALKVDALKQYAAKLGLDTTKFNECLDSGRYAAVIGNTAAEGQRIGIGSTPSLFINGRLLVGAQPFEVFKTIIDEELARKAK